jgi:hypothetical protein
MRAHQTLSDAAKCGLPRAAGWYVLAIEGGELRELTVSENKTVNDFRFASWKTKS